MSPADQDEQEVSREERLRLARERAAAFRQQREAARAAGGEQEPPARRPEGEQQELSSEERIRLARERAEAARRQRQQPAAAPAPAPAAEAPARQEPRRPRAAAGAPPPTRHERIQEIPIVPPQPGTVYDVFNEVLPDVEFVASQGALDVLLTVKTENITRVLQTAKEHPRLAFDYLRCLSGVDQLEQGLELVYQLYSFAHRHNVTIKTVVATDDPHIPSAVNLWRGADWHERETAEMFGIVFDGHPNPAPLLLPEEGLDYFPLRRDHPLAEIEEPQARYLGEEFEPGEIAVEE